MQEILLRKGHIKDLATKCLSFTFCIIQIHYYSVYLEKFLFAGIFFSKYNIVGIFLSNEKLEDIYSEQMGRKCIFLRNYLMSRLEILYS